MGNLSESLKTELAEGTKSIQLIIGFLLALIGIGTTITKALESRFTVSIICLGLFLFIRSICKKIIVSKKISFNLEVPTFKSGEIRYAKIADKFNYLLLIFPLYAICSFFLPIPKSCGQMTTKLGVLITNFEPDGDDPFSHKLHSLLYADLQNTDTILIIRPGFYVHTQYLNFADSIPNHFADNCFNRGIMVYGQRNQGAESFDCSIYMHNVRYFSKTVRDKNVGYIIYLENPDLVNFSIDKQVVIVEQFILGILNYNSDQAQESILNFKKCLELNESNYNSKLVSNCYLFIGNNQAQAKNYNQAKLSYKMGLQSDNQNAYLHYNLATAYLATKDQVNSDKEYDLAHTINRRLVNPLKKDKPVPLVDNRKIQKKIANDSSIVINSQTPDTTAESSLPHEHSPNSDYHLIWSKEKYGIVNMKGD
ncbi:MAG TPA: hypothetical protein VK772_07715, partial [Puia sp.]|nr:hypothetical protein [Puia sp.]